MYTVNTHTHTHTPIRVFVKFPQIFINDLVTKIIFSPPPFVLRSARLPSHLSPPRNHTHAAHPVIITVSKHPFSSLDSSPRRLCVLPVCPGSFRLHCVVDRKTRETRRPFDKSVPAKLFNSYA